MKTKIRFLISIALLFHLYAVLLAAGNQSELAKMSAFFLNPYLGALEITSRWGFFAPDPGPPPLYVEYEMISSNGQSIKSGRWPARRGPHQELASKIIDPNFQAQESELYERFTRKVSILRFVMAAPPRVEKIMGPFFCKQFPEATSVKLWMIAEKIPKIEEVREGKAVIGEPRILERHWTGQTLCQRGKP